MGLFKSSSDNGRTRAGPPSRSAIRGKISGPIPITDDELRMRNSESNILREEVSEQPDQAIQGDSLAASSSVALDATRGEKTGSMAQSGRSQASTSSTHARQRLTNGSSTLRYSTLSQTTDSASPSRKKSSFRAAIGKLFKKRNRKQGSRSTSESEARVGPSNDHHRSDPVVIARGSTVPDNEPKRSASLPVTEFNKALRSHSIGPDDYRAITSARNSFHLDSVFQRRRAATASGALLSSKLPDENTCVLGLSPRPASSQGHNVVDEFDPESIGRALSVDFLTSRRRSRSLSQLPDVAEDHGLVRKRSEEIRYWRASQNPGPLSPDASDSNRGVPGTTETTEPTTDPQEEAPPMETPEPFNFGSLIDMRITEAASLEDRITALEVKNQKLEKLVSQLFQLVPGIDGYSDATGHLIYMASAATPTTYAAAVDPADVEASLHQDTPVDTGPLSPSYSVSEQSNVSFEDEKTFIGSIHPSTREAPRPISTVTIRGATSLPSLPRDGSGTFTPDRYNTLKALLDAERAARHALETRVTQLAHRVHLLSQKIPKPDPNPPSSARAEVSVFEHDDDDDVDDGGILHPSTDLNNHPDTLKPPPEDEPVYNYDDSDDDVEGEEGVDDSARKRAARTLSLGQLTLGKPKRAQQPGAEVDL
ncbi:hypothetical protein F4802DRAFT_541460 [Xylaria palmicola]|nr:hypothetical protein F4802DRAFT_541460 [Xylaria palmicola]